MTDLESTEALLCDDDNENEDYNLDQDEEAKLLREDDDDEGVLTCQVDPLEEDEDEDSHRDKFASERSNDQLSHQSQERLQPQGGYNRNNKPDYNSNNHGMHRNNKKPLLSIHGIRGRGRGGNYNNRISTGKCYVNPILLKGKKPVQSVQPWLNHINAPPFEPERRVTALNTFQQPRFQQPMMHCQQQQYRPPINNLPEHNNLHQSFGPPQQNNNNWPAQNTSLPQQQQQLQPHQQHYYDGPQQQCYPLTPQFHHQNQQHQQSQPCQPYTNQNNFYPNQHPNAPAFSQNSNFVSHNFPQQQPPAPQQPQPNYQQHPPIFHPPQHAQNSQQPPNNMYFEPYNAPQVNQTPNFLPPQHHHQSPQRFINQNHQGQMQVHVQNSRFPQQQQQQHLPPQQQPQQQHQGHWRSPPKFQNGNVGFRGGNRGGHHYNTRGFQHNRFNEGRGGQRPPGFHHGGDQGRHQFKRRSENWNLNQHEDDYAKRRNYSNPNFGEYEEQEQYEQEQEQENEVLEEYQSSHEVMEETSGLGPQPPEYADDEDEETRAYRMKIEEQKRKREEILAEKERNRKLAVMKKTGQVSGIHALQPSQPSSMQARKPPQQRVIANSNLRVLTHLDNSSNSSNDTQQHTSNITGGICNVKPLKLVQPALEKPNPSKEFLATRKVISSDASMLDTSLVVVRNLAASSTPMQLRKLCHGVGHVQSLEMSSKERQAIIRFNSVASAHAFYKKYQRHMLDLSMIQVELIPDTTIQSDAS